MSALCLFMFHRRSEFFHGGMCVCVTHCLAGFESLFLSVGGSRGGRTEERGKDNSDVMAVGGLRNNNQLSNKL